MPAHAPTESFLALADAYIEGREIAARLTSGLESAATVAWDELSDLERTQALEGLRDLVALGRRSPQTGAETAANALLWLARLGDLAPQAP